MTRNTRIPVALVCASALTALVACNSTSQSDSAKQSTSTTPSKSATSTDPEPTGSTRTPVDGVTARALVSHSGGLTLIDTETGETVDSVEREGLLRLSDSGNGRHVVIADADQFLTYDTGIEAEMHGDHGHFYESTPGLTETALPAPSAGHVVAHAGTTTLFADGTGDIASFNTGEIGALATPTSLDSAGSAHHGVAFELADGALVTTRGTEERRDTIEIIDGEKSAATTSDCPDVHGVALAASTKSGDTAAFGCTDGPVVLRGGQFHKVKTNDPYARTGNLAGHPDSFVVLSDYKVDESAELERPTRVALIDTRTDQLRTVELGSSYWFRSLARGPRGEGLVLTYDGSVRVINPKTGRQTDRIEAIDAWRENSDWQQPGPVLRVADGHAYVSDPAAEELVVIDLAKGAVTNRHPLPSGVVELALTTGVPD